MEAAGRRRNPHHVARSILVPLAGPTQRGCRTLADAPPAPPTPERTAAAHTRLEAARRAFAAGELDAGDRQLAAALRLDARIGPEGATILETTLGEEAPAERLLLYGDLLRAAGREADATIAFDRAARS